MFSKHVHSWFLHCGLTNDVKWEKNNHRHHSAPVQCCYMVSQLEWLCCDVKSMLPLILRFIHPCHMAHYGKIWRHPLNQNYITICPPVSKWKVHSSIVFNNCKTVQLPFKIHTRPHSSIIPRSASIHSTRSSAIAEGPHDAPYQLKSCQLPSNSAETTCTTSPEPSISYR